MSITMGYCERRLKVNGGRTGASDVLIFAVGADSLTRHSGLNPASSFFFAS